MTCSTNRIRLTIGTSVSPKTRTSSHACTIGISCVYAGRHLLLLSLLHLLPRKHTMSNLAASTIPASVYIVSLDQREPYSLASHSIASSDERMQTGYDTVKLIPI